MWLHLREMPRTGASVETGSQSAAWDWQQAAWEIRTQAGSVTTGAVGRGRGREFALCGGGMGL